MNIFTLLVCWLAVGCATIFGCSSRNIPFRGMTFPLSAGSSVIKCYSRLHASEAELDSALQQLWHKYPENRISSADLKLIRQAFRGSRYRVDSLDSESSQLLTERNVFKRRQKGSYTHKPVRFTWGLKSANGRAIYSLSTANCGVITSNCDLCLVSALFLPITKPGGNWELSRQERIDAEVWFEEDILVKMRQLIKAARAKSRVE